MTDFKPNPQLKKIIELQQQLKLYGYNSYDIKVIIKDELDCNLEAATDKQLSDLVSALEGYISFAQKCSIKKA